VFFGATLGAEVKSGSMKIFLIVVVVMIVGGTLWADYTWRRWMEGRKRDRNKGQDGDVN